MSGILSPPELLADHHELEDFSSGGTSLDDWLKRRARANQVTNHRLKAVATVTGCKPYSGQRPAQ